MEQISQLYYIIGSYDKENDKWSYLYYGEESGLGITYDICKAEPFDMSQDAIRLVKDLQKENWSEFNSFYKNEIFLIGMRTAEVDKRRIPI